MCFHNTYFLISLCMTLNKTLIPHAFLVQGRPLKAAAGFIRGRTVTHIRRDFATHIFLPWWRHDPPTRASLTYMILKTVVEHVAAMGEWASVYMCVSLWEWMHECVCVCLSMNNSLC